MNSKHKSSHHHIKMKGMPFPAISWLINTRKITGHQFTRTRDFSAFTTLDKYTSGLLDRAKDSLVQDCQFWQPTTSELSPWNVIRAIYTQHQFDMNLITLKNYTLTIRHIIGKFHFTRWSYYTYEYDLTDAHISIFLNWTIISRVIGNQHKPLLKSSATSLIFLYETERFIGKVRRISRIKSRGQDALPSFSSCKTYSTNITLQSLRYNLRKNP